MLDATAAPLEPTSERMPVELVGATGVRPTATCEPVQQPEAAHTQLHWPSMLEQPPHWMLEGQPHVQSAR